MLSAPINLVTFMTHCVCQPHDYICSRSLVTFMTHCVCQPHDYICSLLPCQGRDCISPSCLSTLWWFFFMHIELMILVNASAKCAYQACVVSAHCAYQPCVASAHCAYQPCVVPAHWSMIFVCLTHERCMNVKLVQKSRMTA